MSSILKALRRLEEEKARRNQGSPDIARDILCGHAPRRKASGWVVTGGVFLSVLVGGVLAYWFATLALSGHPVLPGDGGRTVAEARPPAESQPRVVEAPPTETAAENRADRALPGRVQTPSGSVAKAPPVDPPAVASDPPAPSAPVSSVERAAAPPRPPFRLTGIAFQDDPEARMAILNDLPVMAGTLIDGARVEEIRRDRVRLTFEGRTFELRLDPSRR